MGWSRHPFCHVMGVFSAGVSLYKPLVLGEATNPLHRLARTGCELQTPGEAGACGTQQEMGRKRKQVVTTAQDSTTQHGTHWAQWGT